MIKKKKKTRRANEQPRASYPGPSATDVSFETLTLASFNTSRSTAARRASNSSPLCGNNPWNTVGFAARNPGSGAIFLPTPPPPFASVCVGEAIGQSNVLPVKR
jgi:hypothetical protein